MGWWEGNKEEWWGNSYWENSVEIAWEKGKEKEKEKEKEVSGKGREGGRFVGERRNKNRGRWGKVLTIFL